MIYKWKAKSMMKANPKKVGVELEVLRKKKNGHVQPKDVVAEAVENPDSELHKCFEWNNEKAADKYRIEQAGQIIRAIVKIVEIENEKVEIRCFESVRIMSDDDNKKKYYYVSTTDALDDTNMKQQIIDDILNTILEAKSKLDIYKMYVSGKNKADKFLDQAHNSIKPRK